MSASDSTDLLSSGIFHKDSIYIYYQENSVSKEIDLDFISDNSTQTTKVISHEMPWKSASGIKNFVIVLNSTDTDSIYLDVNRQDVDCCTYYTYKDFKYNNLQPSYDGQQQYYRILK